MKTVWMSCIGALLLASASLHAQETTRLAFSVGAGFTNPLGTTGDNLNYGWNVKGGAGINLNSHIALMVNTDFNSFGVDNGALTSLGLNGGTTRIFSARLDPTFHVGAYRHADFYVVTGGGYYRQEQSFSSVNTGVVPAGTNAFFGANTVGGPSLVGSTYSINKPGVDGGLGVAFGSKWHGKFFAEARYNRIFTGSNSHTDFLPVTFGFRW